MFIHFVINTFYTVYKSMDELFDLYKIATAQDNIMILDLPPNRSGRLREKDIQLVCFGKKNQ